MQSEREGEGRGGTGGGFQLCDTVIAFEVGPKSTVH